MSVRKDGKKWAVSFYYNEWNGERVRHRKTGFATKREAQEYERKFLENKSGTPKMSFGTLVDLYMQDCKSRLRSTTYANKNHLISKKILPYFENTPLENITPAMIRKWQTTLIDNPRSYSETYLKTIHNQMSAIFNFSVKYYGLPSNPAAKCGSMGKKNADTMKFWTKEEFLRFEECISDKLPSKVIFNLLYWTGVRSGELLALTLNDFDFDENTISITKTYTRLDGQDIINEPKTPKSKRTIAVPRSIMKLVQDYSEQLPEYEPGERLFPYTKFYLAHEMQRGCRKSDVQRIRIHDIRHPYVKHTTKKYNSEKQKTQTIREST